MHAIRSILWIGAADRFAADVVSEAPSLDVVWERNVGGALALPLGSFDALVLDAAATEEALSQLAQLLRNAVTTSHDQCAAMKPDDNRAFDRVLVAVHIGLNPQPIDCLVRINSL